MSGLLTNTPICAKIAHRLFINFLKRISFGIKIKKKLKNHKNMLDDKDIKKLIVAQKEVFVTKEEFEGFMEIAATRDEMKQGFDKLGNDIKEVKSLLIDFGTRTKTLEGEVDFIKNSLNIQPIKK
jgi:hypothetical protein